MRAPRAANSRMVAAPMTPAAPVTMATLPSRRIRSGIWWFPQISPVVPDFNGMAGCPRQVGSGGLFHLRHGLASGRRRMSPFPRRIRRVNRGPCGRLVDCTMASARIATSKPREMSRTIVLTGFAALVAAMHDLACAAGARADRQYLFRAGAAPTRQRAPRQSAIPRRRRGRAGAAAGPAAADAQSAAAGAGRSGTGRVPVAAIGAAAGHHRHSAECTAARRGGRRRPAPIRRRDNASPRAFRNRRRRCNPATKW